MSQPQIPYIMLDGEEIRLDNVEFLNIEEDISGRDLITFKHEGVTHQSYVVHRPC
jgi:predicted thioredoxin/glutaredoxin